MQHVYTKFARFAQYKISSAAPVALTVRGLDTLPVGPEYRGPIVSHGSMTRAGGFKRKTALNGREEIKYRNNNCYIATGSISANNIHTRSPRGCESSSDIFLGGWRDSNSEAGYAPCYT